MIPTIELTDNDMRLFRVKYSRATTVYPFDRGNDIQDMFRDVGLLKLSEPDLQTAAGEGDFQSVTSHVPRLSQ
jgi:hypothetical protein